VISIETRWLVQDLLNEYALTIDHDELEAWPDFFTDDGVYKIMPAENRRQGLPGVLVLCIGSNMMRDRIKVLREANEFNIHFDRHILGMPKLEPLGGNLLRVTSCYSLFQTDQEGESRLFNVGQYEDIVDVGGPRPLFKERVVVVDTCAVPNLLATPI